MLNDKAVNPLTKKPEMVEYYNKAKGGVDGLDRKCAVYKSQRKSYRWPMAVFYRIFDIAGANARVLFLCFRDNPLVSRFKFLEQLAHELMIPHLLKRKDENIRNDLKTLLSNCLSDAPAAEAAPQVILLEERECDLNEKKREVHVSFATGKSNGKPSESATRAMHQFAENTLE